MQGDAHPSIRTPRKYQGTLCQLSRTLALPDHAVTPRPTRNIVAGPAKSPRQRAVWCLLHIPVELSKSDLPRMAEASSSGVVTSALQFT